MLGFSTWVSSNAINVYVYIYIFVCLCSLSYAGFHYHRGQFVNCGDKLPFMAHVQYMSVSEQKQEILEYSQP